MNGPDPRTRAIEETRMTAQERIEAALAALPNAHVEEWSIHNTRDFWFWDKKYGVDEAKKIEESIFTLRAYSPDLAAEVLRLRAELADSKQQVEMLERGVIAMGCSNDQLRAELAELKRWRDPVAELAKPEEKTVPLAMLIDCSIDWIHHGIRKPDDALVEIAAKYGYKVVLHD